MPLPKACVPRRDSNKGCIVRSTDGIQTWLTVGAGPWWQGLHREVSAGDQLAHQASRYLIERTGRAGVAGEIVGSSRHERHDEAPQKKSSLKFDDGKDPGSTQQLVGKSWLSK